MKNRAAGEKTGRFGLGVVAGQGRYGVGLGIKEGRLVEGSGYGWERRRGWTGRTSARILKRRRFRSGSVGV